MNIGKFIKTRREELGLTDTDLANAIGVSRSNVSRWQSGRVEKIAHKYIKPLAKALECDPMIFLRDKETLNSADSIEDRRAEFERLMTEKNGVYFRLAKGAEELDVSDEDVDFLLEFMKRGKKS